ncbi:MAG TPA: hypothetical protein VKX46_11480, partial [Ktedonobacteraceae bacterium]|nr:hypothetical protein [Ktedonobacteraceae bacterium]
MIPSYIPPGEATPLQVSIPTKTHRPPKRLARHLSWLCVLLACIGCSWFAFQVFLVPQTQQFTPNWHGATWVQAPGTTTPVAYFRYAMQLDLPPDNAFVTVTASQVFRLYVNGIYIGSNTMDFVHGDTPQTYMFDVDATLLTGVNVIGLRVSNLDQKTPLVRASLEVKWGEQTRYYTTGNSWQATGDATLVHPRAEATSYSWTLPTFNAGPWQSALPVANPPRSPLLMVDPQIYERPLPTHWISASSGNGQESYYVRQMSIPDGFDDALLRIVATGQADIFINDHQYMQWNGLVNVPQINVVNYLTTNGEPAPYRNGLMLGIYDISAYIHPGINTIAVHVLAPGTTTAKVGLDALKSAMSLDILVGMQGTYTNPVDSDVGWHTSPQPVDGWTHESNATFSWPPPIAVGRPGASRTFYLPDSNTPRNVQIIPPILVAEICVWSTVAILAAWFLLALVLLRRYYPSRR